MALNKKFYTLHCEMQDCEMHDPHKIYIIKYKI